jgi:ADP-ribose 1''-phosphate phosphatase
MSQPTQPKSSTSEATKTQTKKIQKIRRCTESDEEDIEVLTSEPTKSKTPASKLTKPKPKTKITKQQKIQTPAESEDEDDEAESESEDDEEESEDEQTNNKKPVKATPSAINKQASSKKSGKKRALESQDDDVTHLTTRSKKPRSKAASSSSSKKVPVQNIDSEDDSEDESEDDSEDDVVELTKKPTNSKLKTTQKQPVKASKFTPTRKQMFKTSKLDESESEDEDEPEEKDSSDEEHPKITLTERRGDLFDAPANTLLIHACNCVGSWNAGIALAFQKKYPAQYAIYQAHCKSRTPNSLLSTCLIIPPQPNSGGPQHWIGCLFTSRKYGRGKDSKDDILDSTDSALQGMLEQLEDLKKKPKYVRMCKINSGSFKVPWSETKKLIEALTYKEDLHIEVVDLK